MRPCGASTPTFGRSASAAATLRRRVPSKRRRLPLLRKISPYRQRMALRMAGLLLLRLARACAALAVRFVAPAGGARHRRDLGDGLEQRRDRAVDVGVGGLSAEREPDHRR